MRQALIAVLFATAFASPVRGERVMKFSALILAFGLFAVSPVFADTFDLLCTKEGGSFGFSLDTNLVEQDFGGDVVSSASITDDEVKFEVAEFGGSYEVIINRNDNSVMTDGIKMDFECVVINHIADASPAKGEIGIPQSAHDFYDMCKPSNSASEDALIQSLICLGVVEGVSSQVGMNCQLDDADMPRTNKANLVDASLAAIHQAMWNFAEDNPNLWNLPLGILALSLPAAWPCRD